MTVVSPFQNAGTAADVAQRPATSQISVYVVRPGETKNLYFVSREPGHFPLWCADHDWAGMTGDITIE